MQNQITQLEQDINNDITLINNRLDILDQNVADLDAQDQNFAAQLVIIYGHLAVLDQNVIDLDQRITDLNTQLTQRIDDINAYFLAEVARLDIRIDDVNADLQVLRAQVNRMNHGTVWLAFDRNKENGWLNVKGEAPEGATKAIISILDLDGAKQFDDVWDNVNASNNNYAYDYNNVNDWNPEVYQIKVQFVDDTNTQIAAIVNTQFYALYTIQDFQGFSFQGNEVMSSCFRLDNTMQVSFEFGALERARYDFNLIIIENSTEHNFSLVSNELIEKYNTTSYNGFVDLTGVPTGNWIVKLVAYKRNDGNTIESNDFNVNIIDACANITSGIMITSPTTNSLITMPYPYGSYKAGVYWIQTGPFTLSAQMSTDTQIKGLNCTYKYIDGVNGIIPLAYEALINKNADQNAGTCSRTVNPSWWNGINQVDNSTTLEIYSSFSIDQDEMDSIEIGLDDDAPVIASIVPDTNAYDNNMLIDVSATDNLSGIASVEIRMIHTDTSTVYPNYWADFNADTNTFQVTINTLILPNGKYDINAIVIDVAGNQSNLVVDPVIDHNIPTITSIEVTGNPMLRNETITVDVNANDVFDSNNVAGVNTVTMNVINKDTNTIMLSKDMNLVSGNEANGSYQTTFDTNTDWNLGTYILSFDIWDKTVNVLHLNTDSIDVNLLKNYYFNIADQSQTIPAGTTTTFTLDGNFRDDLGSAGPFIDGNTILITSTIVANTSVIFDGNGFYRIITNAIGAGTYYIDLNYNTADYNYTKRVIVLVGNPSTGRGGGGGGAPLPRADANEPIEEIIIEETEEDNGTGDEGTGNTGTGETGTGDNGTGEVGTGDTGNPGTGFFGLGDAEPTIIAGVGALAIIGLAGGIFYFKRFR